MNKREICEKIEEAIEVAAKWNFFEFNDDRSRSHFTQYVSFLLEGYKENGDIDGYFVKCHEDNTSEFSGDVYFKTPDGSEFTKINFIAARTNVVLGDI